MKPIPTRRYLLLGLTGNLLLAQTLAAQATKKVPALRSVSQTFYTDKTELFAEWRPFIAGESSRFTAHLTKITNGRFQALAEAKITLTLAVEGTLVEDKTEAPERSGVFRLPVTPAKVGTGRIVVEVAAQGATERFVIENVPVYPDIATAMAKQAPAEAGLVGLSKEQSWDIDFATAPVGNGVTVPLAAVVQQQGAPHVYVQRTPEAFELREVKTGKSAGDSVEIVSGLREGERVVVRGADKLARP